MSFIANLVKQIQSSQDIYLIKAEDNGLECWHYIIPDKLKLPLLKQKMQNTPCSIDLEQYGKVIFSGWGNEPAPEIKKQIEDGTYQTSTKKADFKIMYFENIQDNKLFHAFVAVPWEMADKFEYIANYVGNVKLEDWGIVVKIGWGTASEEEIRKISAGALEPA